MAFSENSARELFSTQSWTISSPKYGLIWKDSLKPENSRLKIWKKVSREVEDTEDPTFQACTRISNNSSSNNRTRELDFTFHLRSKEISVAQPGSNRPTRIITLEICWRIWWVQSQVLTQTSLEEERSINRSINDYECKNIKRFCEIFTNKFWNNMESSTISQYLEFPNEVQNME